MPGITRTIVRFGVIAGLAVGGAVLVAGPDRVAALASQVRTSVVSHIDHHIDDPTAMRQQLRDLEAQYPKRIAQVRAQLAEVDEQLETLERDQAVSERVVRMASADYEELSDLIARAEAAQQEGEARLVRIAFDDRTFDVEDAYTRASSINETVNLYGARAEDIERDRTGLENDREVLKELLSKLESEQAAFQTQIAQLDAKIDAIARKEQMAEMMEQRQQRIEELSRYSVASLDQLRSKLARQHAELDSRISALTKRDRMGSYEDKARFQVDAETSERVTIESSERREKTRDQTIIRPERDDDGDGSDKVATIR